MKKHKILFFAYGRAGFLAFDILLNKLEYSSKYLFCFTYDHDDNNQLINSLISTGTDYTFMSIHCKQAYKKVMEFSPDIIVSMHYRDRIPLEILKLAPLGGFNLHPSLLPKYRGCFSAPWVIINGEENTGITYHSMNEKFDDGPIIIQKKIRIGEKDTGYSLFNKLIDLGIDNFTSALDIAINHSDIFIPQIGEPTYFPRKVPYDGIININWPLSQIERFIRAMTFPPKPCAKVKIKNKIYEVKTLEQYLELMNLE
ncbi:MAG: methionyl-tRNA formyltransferase [Candidatus Hodarchaeota archaeon]